MSKQQNPYSGKMVTPDPTKGWKKEKQRRELHKARRQIKANRDADGPRRRDWMNLDETEDYVAERVMPRGERERRRAVLAAVQEVNTEFEAQEPAARPGWQQGTVIEVSTSLCRVVLDGRVVLCMLRGSLSAQESGYTNVVAVGDLVMVSESGDADGVVEQVLPRRTILARPDVFDSHLQQIIAANVDQLLIVASWRDPQIWLELIDRYLITADLNNLSPVICVNKIDLAKGEQVYTALLQPYRNLGRRLIFTSARTGQGIDELRQALQSQTTVLAGLSGVGKSSLLTAVQPGLNLRVGEVSEYHRQGQHTTTQTIMRPLDAGGFVVDTPGIREFGLSRLRKGELVQFYPDLATLASGCRYSNCSHIHEQNCAVKEAVSQGRLSAWRYHNYERLFTSLPV